MYCVSQVDIEGAVSLLHYAKGKCDGGASRHIPAPESQVWWE